MGADEIASEGYQSVTGHLSQSTTRRAFLSHLARGAGAALYSRVQPVPVDRWVRSTGAADVYLRIGPVRVEVAPGHVVETVGYNGQVPGPLIRMREGVPVVVEISNDTDHPEYVHWHGLPVPAEIDGTEEEGSHVVPAHGRLRYRMTPEAAGSRYVHSHAMAMNDLTRGVYSGQFGHVYVEPKKDPGRYDQEIFLATHEWEPFFIDSDDDQMAGSTEKFGETDWGTSMVEVGYRMRSINGKALGHGEPIRVREGQRVLFHIVNASATENLELGLPGHEFLVIALDGNPVPRPQRVGTLELGAGERVDAVVEMRNPGIWILGSTDDDVRGSGLGVLVEYAGRSGPATSIKTQGTAWDYTLFGSNDTPIEPAEVIPMVIERVPADANGFESWTINGKRYDQSQPTKLERNVRYRLVFDNRTADAHPLHLHRNTFELTRVNGKRTSGVRKDVVLDKGFETVEVELTPHQKGLTLFHCHQQLHMDHGFKWLFEVA